MLFIFFCAIIKTNVGDTMKSMYIHIPFCKSICTYCDFCKQLYNETNIKKYLIALNEEIKDRYNGEELDTLYIGGGTPSSLNILELKELFNILKQLKINNIKEYTFECNVNDITEELIDILKINKVNRISIGVESFNKDKLKFMERFSDYEDVKAKIEMIRNKGINNINIDLMYGIPGETLKVLKNDLNLILKLKPTHISTYSLILEEYTKLSINNTKPIDEELELEMYNYIVNKLKKKKYNHYEVSNFALEGYESIHNLNYWNNGEYYGFGLGASGYKAGFRYTNTRNIHEYISGKYRLEENLLTHKDQMDNELMLGLRKLEGINIDEFFNKYNVNIQDVYPVQELINKGELIYKGGNLFVNPNMIYVMNEILVKLI